MAFVWQTTRSNRAALRAGSNHHHQPNNKNNQTLDDHCVFCMRNRETPEVYMSHRIRDPHTNIVTCPQLRNYRCPCCGATGDTAHTRSYCPNNRLPNHPSRQSRFSSESNSRGSPPSKEIVLGSNRVFSNMGTVTNSRYNSAGMERRGYRWRGGFGSSSNNNNNNSSNDATKIRPSTSFQRAQQ